MRVLNLLFLILLIVFPFGQMARIPLDIPSVNLYLQDVVIVLLVFSWLIWHLLKRKRFVLPPLAKPIFGFISIAFISWGLNVCRYSSFEAVVALLYLLRWIAYAGVYFVVWEAAPLPHYPIKQMLLGTGVVSAIFGLLQYIFLPDTRFLFYSGWDEHYYRVIGTFLDPGFTGMIYVLALILIVLRFKGKKPIRYTLFAICYLALAFTYSRASYLAYIIGMGVIAWLRKSWKFFIVSSLLLVVTLFLLPRPGGEGIKLERTSTIQTRVRNYKEALSIARDHPILGVGFNFYRYAQRDYGFLGDDWLTSHAGAGADSSLLFVLATCGLIGLIFYLWLFWEMVKICPAVTIALFVHGFFNNSLFYSWSMLWLWVVLGTRENK